MGKKKKNQGEKISENISRNNGRGSKKATQRREKELEEKNALLEGLRKLDALDENSSLISSNTKQKVQVAKREDSDDEQEEKETYTSSDLYHSQRIDLKKVMNPWGDGVCPSCFLCGALRPGDGGWQKSPEMGVLFCIGCARTTALQSAMIQATTEFNSDYHDGDYTAKRFTEGNDFSFVSLPDKARKELPQIKFDVERTNHVQKWDTFWWQHQRRAGEARKRDLQLKDFVTKESSTGQQHPNGHVHVVPIGKLKEDHFPRLMNNMGLR